MSRKTKRKLRKVKNFLIKASATIAIITWLLVACAIDSIDILPAMLIMGVTSVWLSILALANGYVYDTERYYEREERERKAGIEW